MATESLQGPALKKKISKAKKKPVNFAFVPGKKPADSVLMLHKKKNASLLGKEARAEGDSNKFAFGSLFVRGKVAELTCGRHFGQLAKQCKIFLRVNKVMLNVVVMDENGQEIESDIEDLPDDPEMDLLDLENEAEGDEEEDEDGQQQDEAPAPQVDPQELVRRMKAVQPAVAAAQGPEGA
ncbi:MAG: hypothetical protein KDH20_14195, partial [Rhodocyclaceae bacterium]|nr:hypothetical protein [Rhodocyclaceae bacterium]